MSVTIRLRRTGKKKMPSYRIVVTDSHFSRDGRFLEVTGRMPVHRDRQDAVLVEVADTKSARRGGTDPEGVGPDVAYVEVNRERALHWIGTGAQVSDTVRRLLVKQGILKKEG